MDNKSTIIETLTLRIAQLRDMRVNMAKIEEDIQVALIELKIKEAENASLRHHLNPLPEAAADENEGTF